MSDKKLSPPVHIIPLEVKSREGLAKALRTLKPQERGVFCAYYGFSLLGPALLPQHTLKDIGQAYKLSSSRISQIKDKAIRGLEHISRRALYV